MSHDYPIASLLLGEEGASVFTAVVNPSGRVSSCSIAASSGFPLLDTAACRAIERRARFNPELDLEGQPVEGTYTQTIRWALADDSPPKASALDWNYPKHKDGKTVEGVTRFRIRISEEGKVASCEISRSSGSDTLDRETCLNLRKISYLTPNFDDAGEPVERDFEGAVEWRLPPPPFKLKLSSEKDED